MAGVAALVVGGLSLLRAYTPLIVLPATDYVPADVDPTAIRGRVILLLFIGGAAVILPWLVMIVLARRLGGPTRGAIASRSDRIEVFWRNKSAILLILVVAVFIAMGIFPASPPGSASRRRRPSPSVRWPAWCRRPAW